MQRAWRDDPLTSRGAPSSPGPPAELAVAEIKIQGRQLREAAEGFCQRAPALGASASGLQQFRNSQYSQVASLRNDALGLPKFRPQTPLQLFQTMPLCSGAPGRAQHCHTSRASAESAPGGGRARRPERLPPPRLGAKSSSPKHPRIPASATAIYPLLPWAPERIVTARYCTAAMTCGGSVS